MCEISAFRGRLSQLGIGVILALLALIIPKTVLAQDATPQQALPQCGASDNRFIRFLAGSYVSSNQVCEIADQLRRQQALTSAAEDRAAAAAQARDLALTRVSDLEAQMKAAAACRADELQLALDASRTRNVELLDSLDALTSQIAGLDLQMDQLRGTINAQDAQLDTAARDNEALADDLAALRASLQAAETEALALRGERDSVQASFDNLANKSRADVGRLAANLEETVGTLSACQADFETFRTTALQSVTESGDVGAQLALAQAEINALRARIETMAVAEAELLAQVDGLSGSLETAQSTADKMPEATARLEAAEARAQALEDALKTLQDNNAKQLDAFALDLAKAEAGLESRDAKIEELEAALQAVKANRDADMDSLQDRMALLSEEAAQVPALQTEVQVRNQQILDLETAVTAVRDGLQAQLRDAQDSLSVAQDELDRARARAGQVGELTARLTAAEAEAENLRALLARAAKPESVVALNSALRQWMEQTRDDTAEPNGVFLIDDRLVLSSSASLFQPGSARLSSAGKDKLHSMAAALEDTLEAVGNSADWSLQVLGHADASPAGRRWPSNWELSAFRAAAVVRTLVQAGVPAERLSAVGMGENHPLNDEDNQEAYAKNRRIELQFR